jgi:hypothetical protein
MFVFEDPNKRNRAATQRDGWRRRRGGLVESTVRVFRRREKKQKKNGESRDRLLRSREGMTKNKEGEEIRSRHQMGSCVHNFAPETEGTPI